MDAQEFDGYTFNSLENYFRILSHTGYKSYNKVYNIVILSFLNDLINNCTDLTSEEYRSVVSAIKCLTGTDCTLPYPYHKGVNTLYENGLSCNCSTY